MAIHDDVLATAQRLCMAKGSRTFRPAEVIQALPHLNVRTVRTHIGSRCCVNAPAHHANRLPYFERVCRGVYKISEAYWPPLGEAAERAASYALDTDLRSTIHTVVAESEGGYVAECLEVAVVTQGHSLDETLHNLREAVGLFLADEDPAALGLTANPRLGVC